MPQVRMQYTHDFTFEKPEILVELVGDDIASLIDALTDIGARLNDTPPWIVKTSLSELAKPITKADVKRDPNLADAQKKDEALRILTHTYSSPVTRAETRALLSKYEIAKFGEIPLERAGELLQDAKDIKAKLPKGEE